MTIQKLLHLQLVILRLLESKAADISHDDVDAALKTSKVITLLRERYASDPTFRGYDNGMKFDSLEQALGEHLAVFMPESTKYELRDSGLCLIAGAISYALLYRKLD